LLCHEREKLLHWTFAIGLAQLDLVALVATDHVEVLRQRGEARAGGGRFGDEPSRGLEVGRELRSRHHLDRRDAGARHQFCTCGVIGGGTIFSTFGSLQLPLTM
jgi:hypothetical protein